MDIRETGKMKDDGGIDGWMDGKKMDKIMKEGREDGWVEGWMGERVHVWTESSTSFRRDCF